MEENEKDNHEQEVQNVIDALVSPSDQPLIDAAASAIESIGYIKDIFTDRNSDRTTVIFVFSLLSQFISRMTNITINPIKLIEFIMDAAQEEPQ